jgi:hypothetical protein
MLETLCMLFIAVWIVGLRLAPYAAKYQQLTERARLDALKAEATAARIASANSLIETRRLNQRIISERYGEQCNKTTAGDLKIEKLTLEIKLLKQKLGETDHPFNPDV